MSRSEYLLLTWWLLWGELEATLSPTNIDTLQPSVIRSPAMNVNPDDGFGWTAIFHQIETVSDTDTMNEVLQKTRVLIGAPRGTYPGGLNLPPLGEPASPETGLVYSCPIGPGVCEGVTGDRSRYNGNDSITNGVQMSPIVSSGSNVYIQAISEGRLFDQAPDSIVTGQFSVVRRYEKKEGQLMGSFLYSNGENVVACAPRWITTALAPDGVQPRGICFSGSRNLTNFVTQYPCGGESGSSQSTAGAGFCSGGISATIADDRIHIGAPGFNEFGGSFFSRLLAEDFSARFTSTINPINEGAARGVIQSVHHGFQVVSGYIRSNDRTSPADVLISAPRDSEATYVGKVYLYDTNTLGTTQSSPIVNGSQMAEFFGHSMATCDLTGDGFDELLVGAPMYTNLDPLIVEQGRLYVFFNNGGNIDPVPVIIEGFKAHGRFGFTVTNLGDIDADSHEDFAVSAPYEVSSSSTSNTGAVYVYYGRDTKEDFKNQQPQRIHADDITVIVNSLPLLRTFGFSLSGNIDVDQNGYKDLVVGGYIDQAVVVLRSLPFVNITLSIDDIPDIRVDIPNPSFEVTLRASYVGVGVTGALSVPFTLSEIPNRGDLRLFFSSNDIEDTQANGVFNLTGPNTDAVQVVTVYAMSDFTETRPYQLVLELEDIIRNDTDTVDGLQPLIDLSLFPKIQQFGTNEATVEIIDPCGFDGCASDVTLSVNPSSLQLVLGLNRSVSFQMVYSNIGQEEARGLTFTVSGLPSVIFNQVILSRDSQGGAVFACTELMIEDGTGYVTCNLQDRLLPNKTQSTTLVLLVNSTAFVENDRDFNITLRVDVDMTSNNTEVNVDNNRFDIMLSVESESDINVDASFRRDQFNYVGIVPEDVQSSSDLGEIVRLTVRVDNQGPSMIQNAEVAIRFPGQVFPDQDSRYYLYPNMVIFQLTAGSAVAGTKVNCSTAGVLDPNNLDVNGPLRRRKRSVPMTVSHKQGGRIILGSPHRSKRQTTTNAMTSVIDCSVHPCTDLLCNIQRLTTDAVTITLEFAIDERFYGTAAPKNYSIGVEASVTITDEYEGRSDNTSDNSDSAIVYISPPVVEVTNDTLFLHVIIWPSIAGLFIIVVIFVLLYFCGFFRRKKKPGDGEIEGDFTAPTTVKEDLIGEEVTAI